MFRMDNLLEKWAQTFKPINHDPTPGSRDKRFFRMNSYMRMPEFMSNLTTAKSPSMGYATQVDADLEGMSQKFFNYTHRIFFFVKQAPPSLSTNILDEMLAADAKADGVELAEQLLAWLTEERKKDGSPLRGIEFKGASIASLPPQQSEWWVTELVIEQLHPRNLCVDKNLYQDVNK